MTRKELVLAAVADLAIGFTYYDRKEDEDLPRGEIQASIAAGEVSVDSLTAHFRSALIEALGNS